eukprot:TRINITY_DN4901_c1_g1_i1.p1 TRINITY_DN4901_c1_g1~~TRINITY_DN4901_c1_g1_i1.p1  ORF type:complete len:413 (-),score=105.29 TRINITY_DN4901_c1_g1_i1:45-1283(-)
MKVLFLSSVLFFAVILADASEKIQSKFELKFVQVITRHGARTAFNPLPAEDVAWNCTLVNLGVSVVGQGTAPVLYRKKFIENRQILRGDCSAGALTSEGWQNHLSLGGHFRTRYVDILKFLPETLNSSLHYVRSTDSPRTIASVQANLLGLYPVEKREKGDMVDIFTIDAAKEDILPQTNCGKLNDACNNIQFSAAWKNNSKSLEGIASKLKSAWNVTTLPWWVGLWDNLHARTFHGLPWPSVVDQKMYNQLTDAVLFQLKALYRPNDVKKYGIGRFLEEIVGAMDSFIAGDIQPVRYINYSGHDLTVALILSSLDLLDSIKTWPKFASSIQFEIWNDLKTNLPHVKMLYNTMEVRIPRCPSTTSDSFLCPLPIFKKLISRHIPVDYDSECKSVNPNGNVPKEVADVTLFLC